MELILSGTLSADDAELPEEYAEYRLCEKFGWTPQQIEDMAEGTVRLYLGFMRAEANAGRLRANQSSHYGR